MGRVILQTEEELIQFARSLRFKSGQILTLSGPLGAGKTTFVKGLVPSEMEKEVQSPTFSYLHPYETNPKLFHFDLYRLKDAHDFLALGFDEFFELGIAVIEWPERIESLLPQHALRIRITPQPNGARCLELSGNWDNVLPFGANGRR